MGLGQSLFLPARLELGYAPAPTPTRAGSGLGQASSPAQLDQGQAPCPHLHGHPIETSSLWRDWTGPCPSSLLDNKVRHHWSRQLVLLLYYVVDYINTETKEEHSVYTQLKFYFCYFVFSSSAHLLALSDTSDDALFL